MTQREVVVIAQGRKTLPCEALKLLQIHIAGIGTEPFDRQTQATGEVADVTDHNIDMRRDAEIDVSRFSNSAAEVPQRSAVIQIVGDHHAVLGDQL